MPRVMYAELMPVCPFFVTLPMRAVRALLPFFTVIFAAALGVPVRPTPILAFLPMAQSPPVVSLADRLGVSVERLLCVDEALSTQLSDDAKLTLNVRRIR